jgi:Helix-turn-helix domain
MTLEERLEKIESLLVVLVERQQVREWYSVEEFARIVGKAEFTVREWFRHGRLKAEKRNSGRGAIPAWVVSHEELLRYQRFGLHPIRKQI